MKKRLLLMVFFAVNVFAQRNPADYTRVLLPVNRSVGASYGGWAVQWYFRNDGRSAADVFPLAWLCGLPFPGPGVSMIAKPSLPAERTPLCFAGDVLPSPLVPPIVPIVSDKPGVFLYVETAALPRLSIAGSLRWSTFGSTSATPAPLRAIPEGEFFSGRRSILGVPRVEGSRYALRIYALPETAQGARVTVRVYDVRAARIDGPEETLLSTTTLVLDPPAGQVQPCNGPCDVPAVGYLPATAQLFDFTRGGETTLRVEVEPDSDALRWWALVSATNAANDAGLFTP